VRVAYSDILVILRGPGDHLWCSNESYILRPLGVFKQLGMKILLNLQPAKGCIKCRPHIKAFQNKNAIRMYKTPQWCK